MVTWQARGKYNSEVFLQPSIVGREAWRRRGGKYCLPLFLPGLWQQIPLIYWNNEPSERKLAVNEENKWTRVAVSEKKTFPLPPFNHQYSYSVETVECKTIGVKSVFFCLHCIIAYASRTRSLIHFFLFLLITFYRFNICDFTFYKHLIKDTILFSWITLIVFWWGTWNPCQHVLMI